MLLELSIRNFAIIEDLHIRLGSGLTILSGETGAGKSIIINAVNLLLGGRASAALIRTGAENAELEALFEVPAKSAVAQAMGESGFDPAEGLMVRRVISSNDRHRNFINGRMATMQALGEMTAHLASISGQHAHQGLLREESHLTILDQFGDLLALRAQYKERYDQLLPLIRREAELRQRQARQGEHLELLRFQRQEIEAAKISPDEDQQLEKERLRLKNGESLFHTVQQAVEGLYSSDGAVFERLGQLAKELGKAGRLDDRLAARATELEDLTFRCEDISGHLRDYLHSIDLDPQQLEAVEARLVVLHRGEDVVPRPALGPFEGDPVQRSLGVAGVERQEQARFDFAERGVRVEELPSESVVAPHFPEAPVALVPPIVAEGDVQLDPEAILEQPLEPVEQVGVVPVDEDPHGIRAHTEHV
ncbi:MAG: AAA family ATPase, partial [Desulfobacteraceae bacterium]|nr:AAA family ATPase [Desulfobacteraceae bacterium]